MLTRHAVGEKRFQDAKRYGYAGLMVGGMIPSAVLLLFAAAPEQFISLFINPDTVGDDRIIERAKLFLFISTLGLIPDAIRNIFSGTLRGYNDTAFASLSALFSVIGEGMLTSVSLGFGSSLDALGVLLGRTVAFTVGSVIRQASGNAKVMSLPMKRNWRRSRINPWGIVSTRGQRASFSVAAIILFLKMLGLKRSLKKKGRLSGEG